VNGIGVSPGHLHLQQHRHSLRRPIVRNVIDQYELYGTSVPVSGTLVVPSLTLNILPVTSIESGAGMDVQPGARSATARSRSHYFTSINDISSRDTTHGGAWLCPGDESIILVRDVSLQLCMQYGGARCLRSQSA